ncbi:hypothetical protein AGMMS50293_06480 [Spirochaetia bacterium]|nr:hypothetical protein AGMMS50293_06480 [Spirochaetia bacterium]
MLLQKSAFLPLLLGLLFLPALLFPLGGTEQDGSSGKGTRSKPLRGTGLYAKALDGQYVELAGRIRLVGSAPFPELVLSDGENNDWYIEKASREIVSAYEQQTVTIRGKLTLQDMILANGTVLDKRRMLSELTLIKH